MAKDDILFEALGRLTGLEIRNTQPIEALQRGETRPAIKRTSGFVPPHLGAEIKSTTSVYSGDTEGVSLAGETSGVSTSALSISTHDDRGSEGESSTEQIHFEEMTSSPTTTLSKIPPEIDIRFTPQRPQYGLQFVKMGPKSVYINTQFINCKFDDVSPTVFSNCRLIHVIFKDCDFRGWRFVNVVMDGNSFYDCSFKDLHWTNMTHSADYRYKSKKFPAFEGKVYPAGLGSEKWEQTLKEEQEANEKARRNDRENGWGTPEGFEYGSDNESVGPPVIRKPRESHHRLPAGSGILSDNTPMSGVDFKIGSGELYDRVTFQDCTFDGVTFENCFFRDAMFESCSFRNIHLKNVALTRITYRGCKFDGFKWLNRSLTSDKPLIDKVYGANNDFEGPRCPQQILDQADRAFRQEQSLIKAIDQVSKAPVDMEEGGLVRRAGRPRGRRTHGRYGTRKNLNMKTPEELAQEKLEPGQRYMQSVPPAKDVTATPTAFVTFEFT